MSQLLNITLSSKLNQRHLHCEDQRLWANELIHSFLVGCLNPLLSRNQYTGWFAPTCELLKRVSVEESFGFQLPQSFQLPSAMWQWKCRERINVNINVCMAFNFLIPIGHALTNDLLAPYLYPLWMKRSDPNSTDDKSSIHLTCSNANFIFKKKFPPRQIQTFDVLQLRLRLRFRQWPWRISMDPGSCNTSRKLKVRVEKKITRAHWGVTKNW